MKYLVRMTFVLAPLAVGAWKFGPQFLGQFFYCPLCWMSAALVGFALLAIWRGVMPMRSGPAVYRDKQPERFRMNVRYVFGASAVLYAMNFAIDWMVMSRPRVMH